MKPITLALVAIISCVLSVSARAATLETSAGKPVPEGQVSAELIQAVADFEKNSIFVVDSASDDIIDVFVRADFYSLLGYTTSDDNISSDSSRSVKTKSVWLPVCTEVVVTRFDVGAETGILSCGESPSLSPNVQKFASVKWMARTESSQDGISSLSVNGSSGVIYLTLDSKNYFLRFKVTAQEMATKRNALKDLRRIVEEKRVAAEEDRLAVARAEAERLERVATEEQRKLELEEQRKRVAAEEQQKREAEELRAREIEERRLREAEAQSQREVEEQRLKREAEERRKEAQAKAAELQTKVKAAVGQAVMLDGFLALPVAAVAGFTDHAIAKHTYYDNCIVATTEDESEDEGDQVCDEEAWTTTNFVPKVLSGRMYAALAVHNGVFSGIAFQHDAKTKTVKVKLTQSNDIMTLNVALPAKVSAYKTQTRARIYTYTKDSAPKCSTSTVKRSGYTLKLTTDEPYQHLDVNLTNTSNSTVLVVWDESVLRMPKGASSGVIHLGTRYSEKNSPQSNTPVAPRASLEDILAPKATIRYSDTLEDWEYSLFDISLYFSKYRNSLFVFGSTQTVSGVLALIVGGKKVYENFSVTCTVKPGEYRI